VLFPSVSDADTVYIRNLVAKSTIFLLRAEQLILYPDSGHGDLFQYPALFVNRATLFVADRT
jgi:hypothetical protein